jgi:hypothetical protein
MSNRITRVASILSMSQHPSISGLLTAIVIDNLGKKRTVLYTKRTVQGMELPNNPIKWF